jgi:Fe-S oxidoreductase
VIANRQARWMLEKSLGLAQGRKLPRAASQTFLRRARRRRLTRPLRRSGAKVVYFVDTYANYFDPQLAESLVAVLEHNAVTVYVHPAQKASGMAMISVGAVDGARKQAAHNVRILAEAVRQGYHIVTAEPSAALALTREYPALLDDDDVRLVANNTSEACSYLWQLHRIGKLLLDFTPVHASAGYHLPCHLKALQVGSPSEHLLRLIPGLRVQRIEAGCSGMAGTYGLKRENYRSSLRAGLGLITSLRQPGLHIGTTECSACKIQMEQGTSKPTIHPLKLLALSYGLKPELAALVNRRGEELVVT